MAIAKKKNSNKGIWIGLIIGAVIVGLVATPMIMTNNQTDTYQTATVTKEDLETYFTFTGDVASKNSQKVIADKVIQIETINVVKGAKVKKDDVLFTAKDGTTVNAKVAGVVTQIYVEADEQVISGSLLCDIYDLDNLQVTLKIDEFDLSSINEGDSIDITINALDKEVEGKISDIADTGVNQNGVAFFTATVDLEKDTDIKVGMTAEAKVNNEFVEEALIVPVKSLVFDDENNAYLYIKNSDGELIKMGVTVGIDDGKYAEILNGVTHGMTVYYSATDEEVKDDGGFQPPMPGR